MDSHTLNGISTFFVMAAFLGVCWWAYGARRKKKFDEAAQLPFEDEEMAQRSLKELEKNKDE